MVDSQLLKGILEGCVLSIISRQETYGYQILSDLEAEGLTDIGEGTLYPVLTRLSKNGLIACRRAKSPLGPIRNYYTITPSGLERLAQFQSDFQTISQITQAILNKED